MEVLQFAFAEIDQAVELARNAEKQGWHGLVLSDSQNLQSDPYQCLALAGAATTRLRLGTGVTNPLTRHPAVTACSIATLQRLTGGRAVLGIGRGDSAVLQLGLRPAGLADFEKALSQIQGFLRGEAVVLNGASSRIQWLSGSSNPKAPVDVYATGPRTIAVGARHAERLTFAVGAHPQWVRWAVATARREREGLGMGLCVCVGVADDHRAACELVRGNVGIFAAFGGAASHVPGVASPEDVRILEAAAAAYASGITPPALPDAFIDRFAVVGPPAACVERLQALIAEGLSHLVVVGPSKSTQLPEAADHAARFAAEVLPHL